MFVRNDLRLKSYCSLFGLGFKLILGMIMKLYLDVILGFSERVTRISCGDDRLLFQYLDISIPFQVFYFFIFIFIYLTRVSDSMFFTDSKSEA